MSRALFTAEHWADLNRPCDDHDDITRTCPGCFDRYEQSVPWRRCRCSDEHALDCPGDGCTCGLAAAWAKAEAEAAYVEGDGTRGRHR